MPIESTLDFIVLASDGVWDCNTSQEAVDFIIKENAYQSKIGVLQDMVPGLEKLMDTCVADELNEDKKDDSKKGSDNVSIIVISFLH